MERSLIILKPDCMEQCLWGEVLQRFAQAGYQMVACKMAQLTPEILREHYAHVADKPFFPRISEYMQSRPVIILVLEGENVIQGVRDLLGPTDSTIAPKGTIRGDMGTDKTKNVVHASDGPDTARAEIARFFSDGEVF